MCCIERSAKPIFDWTALLSLEMLGEIMRRLVQRVVTFGELVPPSSDLDISFWSPIVYFSCYFLLEDRCRVSDIHCFCDSRGACAES